MSAYDAIPTWSEKDTRCAVCLLPLATEADDARHDAECDSSPCWCEALCWAAQAGGECFPVDGQDFDVDELFLALRGCQERIAALEAAPPPQNAEATQ